MSWKEKSKPLDIYFLKGMAQRLCQLLGIRNFSFEPIARDKMRYALAIKKQKRIIGMVCSVNHETLVKFDIRQPVYFLDLFWSDAISIARSEALQFTEIPRQLPVYRDLAMIVERATTYGMIEKTIDTIGLEKLKQVELFDIFESDKLGTDKKSLAVSFTFLDDEKTLTDKEIDSMMNKIIQSLETNLQAQIRSN
jgi:phenylalanyl-tRNA synthetase beta chain